MMGENVTSEWLKKELESAEIGLANNDRKRRRGAHDEAREEASSPMQRLLQLNDKVDCLELERDASLWASAEESSTLMDEAQHCIHLGELLCRHKVPPPNTEARRFYDTLLTEEYQPLYRYMRSKLVVSVRLSLREAGYPSEEACSRLTKECQDLVDAEHDTTFASYCFWLDSLQKANTLVKANVSENDKLPAQRSDVIVELCRPLVERVRFHFVQTKDRITSKRVDRLPEWLLSYVKEHCFEGGPWDLVETGMSKIVDHAPFQFLNEMVQLAQYVLAERNFFRNQIVTSNPLHLTKGIEQLLLFDSYIRDLLPRQQRVPVGLTQSLVVGDADLWKWFLDREREATLLTMFESDISERPPIRISPRSEIFCALIHSIRCKASLFETPGPYLKRVAVPLCQSYLEAVHTMSTDLRNLLTHRKLPGDNDLETNVEMWIELINGTQAAAVALLKQNTSQGDHDLARVGRSFERLREALIEESSTTIVETLLMERARLAAYLMRCSYVLASSDITDNQGLSPDLYDVASVFSLIVEKCSDSSSGIDTNELESFAPAAIRMNVIDRLADKFLEVVLDAHGMTPELMLKGCLIVAEDVKVLFHGLHSPLADRLLQVNRFMTMDSKNMHGLRMALFGLSQTPNTLEELPLLKYEQFAFDGTLLDEAISMIRAKGYGVHLEDAISIMNRRRDAFYN